VKSNSFVSPSLNNPRKNNNFTKQSPKNSTGSHSQSKASLENQASSVSQKPLVEVVNASKTRLKILPEEHKLFELLLEIVNRCKLNCTLRVAGGWVRDKVTSSSFFPLVSLSLLISSLFAFHF
jgi:hypothetical protein